jgi:hypothetical protein
MLFGVAVGTIYAATAALLKSITNIVADHGLANVVISWQMAAVVVLGGSGLILSQIAFQSGPLTASLPTIATVDPLLSVGIGVLVFEEHLNSSPGTTAMLVVLLVALGLAVTKLARAEAQESGTGQITTGQAKATT